MSNFQPIIIDKKLSADDDNDGGEGNKRIKSEFGLPENEENVRWSKFIDDLYVKFSEYEIQKQKEKYNVANLEDWGESNRAQGIVVNENNFELFLNKTAEYNIAEHDNIKNIAPTGLQLEELNHVLNSTLRKKMQVSCIEPYLFIKGNYIDVKDIVIYVLSNMDDSCADLFARLKFINVFALNTIFIDDDLKFSGLELPITVIAPKWQIIGTRELGLNGANGDSKSLKESLSSIFTSTKTESRAKDGVGAGCNGEDDRPGRPGGSGGTFFGIGENFIDGANFIITADGGAGSSGRDGGKGANGKDGRSATMPSGTMPCDNNVCVNYKKKYSFDCYERNCKYFYMESRFENKPVQKECDYEFSGMPGMKGGNGGNGGIKGKGGKEGNIVLFELNSFSGILRYKKKGKDGDDGKGGTGGIGGYKGDGLIARCSTPFFAFSEYKWYVKDKINNKRKLSERAPSGKNGTDGANIDENIEAPNRAYTIDKPAEIINQYKNYLRENLKDRFKRSFLTRFLNKLDGDDNVKNVYDTMGLIDELRGLEGQFRELNKDVDFIPFYHSLLNRISEYARNPERDENSRQSKKVLRYLYTATLGRMYNAEDNFKSDLIIDIIKYLNIVQEDIEKLKDLQNTKDKIDVINNHKQQYEKGIDAKIREARKIIENEIVPEIDDIGSQIDDRIDSLINEVIALQKQTDQEIQHLNEKKQELVFTSALQGLFAPIKIFGQFISFLGPVGEFVDSTIGVGSTVVGSPVSDDRDNQIGVLQLLQSASDLESLKYRVKSIRDRKDTHLKKLLKSISQEIQKYPEKLGSISDEIDAIRGKLNGIDEDGFGFKEIEVIENEFEAVLRTKEMELMNSRDEIANKETADALVTLGHFKKALHVGGVMLDTYTKYENNQAKLDTIDKAIEQAEDKFQKLKRYEEKVYNTIAPMLQNIQHDLDDIKNRLDTKSKLALDVTKWKVQSTLRDIKSQMKQMTRGFKVQDNLARVIEKLEEAMTTLINIYDHIQDYIKDQRFADYIADISSVSADDVDISNVELRNAVRDLEIMVRSSIVLHRYRTAVDAFKQFVFPLAHYFYKGITLPSHLKLGADIEGLVNEASTEIGHLKSKVETYKISVTIQDQYMRSGEFSSRHGIATRPFFVWKNEKYMSVISKLLSGREVVIKADVADSAPNKDAIKFNAIEINLKTRNETLQREIDEKLIGFQISATHLGNSYFRYDNSFYVIASDSQNIQYYFKKNDNGDPIDKNGVYEKMKAGDLMLSPYAMWKLKLSNVTDRISFDDLTIYKDQVDLELSGNGSYISRDSDIPDLHVEKYYEALDAYEQLDLNVDSETVGTLTPLQDSNSTRNKREINQETKNEIDQEQQAQVNAERKNADSKSNKWFSWMRLPGLNILPAADASVIEDDNSINEKGYADLGLDNMPFNNRVKSSKGAVSPKISKQSNNTVDLSKNSFRNHSDHVMREEIPIPSKNPAIGSGLNNSENGVQATSSVDVDSFLMIGQLLVYKIFGRDKFLSGFNYLSPDHEHNMRVNKLAAEIAPIINDSGLVDMHCSNFIKNYNSECQWYKDLHKKGFGKIMSIYQKKNICNYSSEEIFMDSLWMKDDFTIEIPI